MMHRQETQLEITGKNAVVTGGGAGIGRAVAVRLAREGANVVVADVDEEAGRRTAEEVGGAFVAADVTVDADVEALVADVVRTGEEVALGVEDGPAESFGRAKAAILRSPTTCSR